MSRGGRIGEALFIIGAPRSGTSILHRVLSLHDELWGPFGESHAVLEGPFRPDLAAGGSNRLTAADLTPARSAALHRAFWRASVSIPRAFEDPAPLARAERPLSRMRVNVRAALARRSQGGRRPGEIRLLEKTPKNCLRVPMLAALVPGARFVYLRRDPASVLDSLIAGWRAWDRVGPLRRKRFRTYPVAGELGLADYAGRWWCFLLTPGWRALAGAAVADVAAAQYRAATTVAAADLAALPRERWTVVEYEDLLAAPAEVTEQVLRFAGLGMQDRIAAFARAHVRAAPRQGLRHAAEVAAHEPALAAARAQAAAVLGL